MGKIIEKVLYGLDDITVVPAVTSTIEHRAECNVKTNEGTLPIFVSPMDTVIGIDNYKIYENNEVIPIIPRTEKLSKRFNLLVQEVWTAFSLNEYESLFCDKNSDFYEYITNYSGNNVLTVKALIDIANGHIGKLIELLKNSKNLAFNFSNKFNLVVMVGNIANPETFKVLADAGADYVRCSIGSGGLCITSANCTSHYPMASLINECRELKNKYHLSTKIIADGGINSYNRAIKALACGADYVMIGSTFGKCFESSGNVISADLPKKELVNGLTLEEINKYRKDNSLSEEEKKYYIGMNLQKVIYGMSTKRAQKRINEAAGASCKLKTSEGIEKTVKIEYTLHQWLDNFVSYLRSAMSYSNVRTIEEFNNDAILMVMSLTAQNSFNK